MKQYVKDGLLGLFILIIYLIVITCSVILIIDWQVVIYYKIILFCIIIIANIYLFLYIKNK